MKKQTARKLKITNVEHPSFSFQLSKDQIEKMSVSEPQNHKNFISTFWRNELGLGNQFSSSE